MIEQLMEFPDNVVAFACHAHVTRSDYENTLIPVVEKAFAKQKDVRLYYEIGPDFEYIDPGAVWKDFETGLKHWMHWERIAVVTDVEWIRHTMRAFSFLLPGEIRLFPVAERNAAKDWIVAVSEK